MPVRSADATWSGDLKSGEGQMMTESGAYDGEFTFATRFGDEAGTNPEELLAAAHGGCFSMAFANEVSEAGYTVEEVNTHAEITLEDGEIVRSHLVMDAKIPEIDEEAFHEIAEQAHDGCPVSSALGAIPELTLDATLQ
ncbi:MAG: OsmC family peroxiredoxin [Halobacteriales archaeon]